MYSPVGSSKVIPNQPTPYLKSLVKHAPWSSTTSKKENPSLTVIKYYVAVVLTSYFVYISCSLYYSSMTKDIIFCASDLTSFIFYTTFLFEQWQKGGEEYIWKLNCLGNGYINHTKRGELEHALMIY